MKKLFSFADNILLAVLIGSAISFIGSMLGYVINPIKPFLIVLLFGLFMPKTQGTASMAIQKEIWQDWIVGNLFKGSEWMQNAFNADQYVLAGSVVHIPQAGAKPTVVKNRSVFPASVVQRVDTDITYALDEYTSTPTHIKDADKVELSYDKIGSVLSEHMDALRELVGDHLLYSWRAELAASIVRTTGAATLGTAPGATGNRKLFVKDNLMKARTLMNKQNVSKEDRFALLPSDMYDQLMSDVDLIKRDYAAELDMKNGIITRLFGFNLMERSEALIYDNSATPVAKAVGAAAAGTDNLSVLCWQKNSVERALGTVDFFEDLRNPTYYGDIYSALLRMGGRKRRASAEGVIAIVQEATV